MLKQTDKEFSFETSLLREGAYINAPATNPETAPIYLTTAFNVEDLDDLYERYEERGFCYNRNRNPNRSALMDLMTYAEHGEASVICSSGMAAISTTILALVKAGDDYSIEPWIAKSGVNDGNTWTIQLKSNVVFSNGNPVSADIVVKNLQRAGEVNERAAVFSSAQYEVIDDTTFTITTEEFYPTMLNDLTDPFTSVLDLDNITSGNFNNEIIATGPFKLTSYTPENSVQLDKNENYWDGGVNLDKVAVYYIPDAATEAMSLQSGEIDMYVGPDTDSIAMFSSDSNFTVASTPQGRIYMYIFNIKTITDINVRKAIIMSVNKEDICIMLSGTATPAVGAFSTDSAYGDVTGDAYDPEAASKLLEDAGYTKNADGYFEKDGEVLTVKVGYYAARSIDKITTLIQDELKTVGIQTDLQQYEDPDSTYMTTGDFDMGMYFVTTTSTGDPYSFLNSVMSTDGKRRG